MNADLSVAPEIAQLADPINGVQHAVAVPRTDGRIAGDLADLAVNPQRWWDLVRFEERVPVRIPLPDVPGTWLLVLPPGTMTDCDCRQAMVLAGEAVEITRVVPDVPNRPLRPGRVRVHGTLAPHHVRTVGPGYSVTLCYSPGGRSPQGPPDHGEVPPPLPPTRGQAPGSAPAALGTYPVVGGAPPQRHGESLHYPHGCPSPG